MSNGAVIAILVKMNEWKKQQSKYYRKKQQKATDVSGHGTENYELILDYVYQMFD